MKGGKAFLSIERVAHYLLFSTKQDGGFNAMQEPRKWLKKTLQSCQCLSVLGGAVYAKASP